MSGDHNMNQTDSGWRKRQIALDKKAENARELGLDYEPDKTVIEMAEQASLSRQDWWKDDEALERFAELVRADEREACAKVCDELPAPDIYSHTDKSMWDVTCMDCAAAIRARKQS